MSEGVVMVSIMLDPAPDGEVTSLSPVLLSVSWLIDARGGLVGPSQRLEILPVRPLIFLKSVSTNFELQ